MFLRPRMSYTRLIHVRGILILQSKSRIPNWSTLGSWLCRSSRWPTGDLFGFSCPGRCFIFLVSCQFWHAFPVQPHETQYLSTDLITHYSAVVPHSGQGSPWLAVRTIPWFLHQMHVKGGRGLRRTDDISFRRRYRGFVHCSISRLW